MTQGERTVTRALVNLVLLELHEAQSLDEVCLTGRRAQHLRKVLRCQVGDRVRMGVVDGLVGTAEVSYVERDRVCLRVELGHRPPDATAGVLILAICRPKVLLRCLEHAAALGFSRIELLRTKRVEKSHMLASSLDDATIGRRLRLGLEQSRRTALPRVTIHPRFRAFCEDALHSVATPTNRFVAHQDAPTDLVAHAVRPDPMTLVIGPEGGLMDFEVEALCDAGFRAGHVGAVPLRIESALSYVAGHIDALRRLAATGAALDRGGADGGAADGAAGALRGRATTSEGRGC